MNAAVKSVPISPERPAAGLQPGGAPPEHVDVLIVGAGLSGIGAAVHLQKRCPGKTYAILEARAATGGTWDLFRYPGVRSDSDMFTLGYAFRPWHGDKAIADGPSILAYVRDTAAEYGIERKIRLEHRVTRAAWSSAQARWTVDVLAGSGDQTRTLRFTCHFLFMCSGYYHTDQGYRPTWPGEARFRGKFVHPQFWPEDLDYRGKRIVVIGSGATAVTLVPELAKEAQHVVMLQRSPTYIVSRPARDKLAKRLYRRLPVKLAYGLTRWKNILLMLYFRRLADRKPERVKRAIVHMAKEQVGPNVDVARHLTPTYNPWEQRLCLVPDGDLFLALKAGSASIVTDHIRTFTESGIQLESGESLDADIVVTATGLELRPLGGLELTVDGNPVNPARTLTYKGLMFSDVPNLAATMGYTKASWTLKSDLTATYVCRLLNYMDRHAYAHCAPRRGDAPISEQTTLDLKSGYILRAQDRLPRQGDKPPWRMYQNYALDLAALRYGRINDGVMAFTKGQFATSEAPTPAAGVGG
jgi:monooxygenase